MFALLSISQKMVPGPHLLFWRWEGDYCFNCSDNFPGYYSVVRDNLRFWDNNVGISKIFLLPWEPPIQCLIAIFPYIYSTFFHWGSVIVHLSHSLLATARFNHFLIIRRATYHEVKHLEAISYKSPRRNFIKIIPMVLDFKRCWTQYLLN